jgi:kinesin family protein 11
LNEQQAENERLHQQVLEANAAVIEANKASQGRLNQVIDEEKQQLAEERRQLLAQITSLITTNAEAQDMRLTERVSDVCEEMNVANAAFETKQDTYSEGMHSWVDKSKDILVNVSKSRDGVKSKIKLDFAVSICSPPEKLYTNLFYRPLLNIRHRSRIRQRQSTRAPSRLSGRKWNKWTRSSTLWTRS